MIKSKIHKLRAQQAAARKHMLTFCMRPSRELFQNIVRDASKAEYFTEWRAAAILKFGYDEITEEIINITSNLNAKTPSLNNSMRVLYMFYASGDQTYLTAFYESMGEARLKDTTRKYLADIFHSVMVNYRAICKQLIALDAEHFDKINVKQSDVDFRRYEQLLPADTAKYIDQPATHAPDQHTDMFTMDGTEFFPQKIYGIM